MLGIAMEWLTEALNRVKHGTTRGNGLLIHLCSAAFNPRKRGTVLLGSSRILA
jgi:hypothetical protein